MEIRNLKVEETGGPTPVSREHCHTLNSQKPLPSGLANVSLDGDTLTVSFKP
jgi:hypothetical protein